MNRHLEWVDFHNIVTSHILNYTIPQYGDMPGDNLSTWEVEDCLKAIDKYTKRNLNENRRGRKEAMRDMVKIAHFAAVAFWKMFASARDERKVQDLLIDIAEGR